LRKRNNDTIYSSQEPSDGSVILQSYIENDERLSLLEYRNKLTGSQNSNPFGASAMGIQGTSRATGTRYDLMESR
jgi:hypothetical protein